DNLNARDATGAVGYRRWIDVTQTGRPCADDHVLAIDHFRGNVAAQYGQERYGLKMSRWTRIGNQSGRFRRQLLQELVYPQRFTADLQHGQRELMPRQVSCV